MNKVTNAVARKSLTKPAKGGRSTPQFKMTLKSGKAFCGKLCVHLSK